jgi:EAL domain-containing protein (putative c-di-GMP-specific phosphodiesterase class I)
LGTAPAPQGSGGAGVLALDALARLTALADAADEDRPDEDDDGREIEQLREPVARVGDDEFMVARRGSVQGPALAEKIVDLVGSPLTIDDLEIVMSASVGAAVARAGAHEQPSAETLIRNAATAMYEAKAAGRNRWKLFTAVGDDSAINEIRLLGEIREALLHEQLRLVYQPQLNLANGETQGFEALVRWDHPDRGVVGPMGFIEVAEKSGLINQVGRWVCRSAIEECGKLNRAAGRPTTMSVNISARQLGDSRLAETVAEMLLINDVEPHLLTLEITETGLISDAVRTRENLERLHAAGIRLSIDDFGTGHAGFAYLKDFPVDELKIDRSFVAGLGTSPEDTAIVVSCIELAHAMGINVVAEGVETAAQMAQLRELGCDIVQGYLYSPPLDHAALGEWLGRGDRAKVSDA